MGIEAIGSIGKVASVAPAIGRVASIGPSIGRISNPFKGIDRPANFAENKGQSLLNPLGIETIRNPFVGRVNTSAPGSQLRAADVIAEAEAIVRRVQTPSVIARREQSDRCGNLIFSEQAPSFGSKIATGRTRWYIPRYDTRIRTPEPAVVRLPNPTRHLDVRVITRPEVRPIYAPKVEALPQSTLQRKTESRPTTSTYRMVQTEQVMKQKKKVKEQKKDDPRTKKETKQSLLKIKIVEAIKITLLRRLAIFEAARKVKEEAEKKGEKVVITGRKLARFLSGEFWKYLSPLALEQGFDGTIPLTLRSIENNPREYISLETAQRELSKPVEEHIPLQQGEGGRVATIEEVREVFEGKEKESLKSQTPAEIVARRVIYKNVEVSKTGQETVVTEEKVESAETSLANFPTLAEVFQKAA